MPNTGRKRQGGNASREQSPPAKRQKGIQTPPKRSGGAHDGGQQLEMKVAAVIGLRGMARGDNFKLSTNKREYGNLDDLVYTTDKTGYYLQLKHTDKPGETKLVLSELVPLLYKCFESYCSIIQDPNFKQLESSEFIIYTNKQLGPEMENHNINLRKIDVILKTCETGKIFNFIPHNDNEKKIIDVYTLVKKKVEESEAYKKLSGPEQTDKLEMVSGFLMKLIMATGQKSHEEIDNVIIDEIRKLDAEIVDPEVCTYETVFPHFKTHFESWWRKKHETMTPETLRKWLQEAKIEAYVSVVGSTSESCKQKFFRAGIKFSDKEISWLQDELSDKGPVHLSSDAPKLCSILLLDCLDTSKCTFVTFESLQSNKNMFLHAWLKGDWKWLIVFCDSTVRQSDISDTCREISDNIKHDLSRKRVVILTACSVQQVGGFVLIEHKFSFQQLSKESQENVLEKTIKFQGCEVKMSEVLQRHGNVQHVLGPELVTDLVTEETSSNIGELQENEGYYAPRVLERYVVLQLDVLQNPNDVFVLSGTIEKDLLEIVPLGTPMASLWNGKDYSIDFIKDEEIKIFWAKDEDVESEICNIFEKFEGNALHWVQFKNGYLLWKMSKGDTDSLLDYIDTDKREADKRTITELMKCGNGGVNEESIWDLGERTVLVVDEPGMGKTRTTTHVAWRTKELDPTSWVVRINCNDQSEKLQKLNTATFNLDSLVEFLRSASFPESKYKDNERILLKQALQNSGNVTVLMDGFDEISPTYEKKVFAVLSELNRTKVERIWVTSRPVQKNRLEKELCVTAFSLRGLSRDSQIEMLRNLWMSKGPIDESKLNEFFDFVNSSVRDFNFTRCPLYLKMIATVYENEFFESLSNAQDLVWRCSDLPKLYEGFVETILDIYHRDKQNVDLSKCSVQDGVEKLKESLFINLEECALVAMLPPDWLESLHDKEIKGKVKKFLDTVKAGKEKTGIMMNAVNGKPVFTHRSFAEFFTARWFSRNFKNNREALKKFFTDSEYRGIINFFDMMFAEGRPLHYAVIQSNSEAVKDLSENGCDVNTVDKGGRTVMHLIASRSGWYERKAINCKFNFKDFSHNPDLVLQWTPLHYATYLQKWDIVEELLKINVDRSGLDIIKVNAQNELFIGQILKEFAEEGYLLLLKFLHSIPVDVHKALVEDYEGYEDVQTLQVAVQGERLEVVKWLIEQGADCNTPYSNGQTPLFFAVTVGSLDIVRALVEGGASLDIRDKAGTTVIDWAKKHVSDTCRQSTHKRKNRGEDFQKIVEYLQEKS